MYYSGFLKVLNLHVMAQPSRLALIIGAWLVLQGISKSSEFADVGSVVFRKVLNLRMLAPPSRLAVIIGAWLVFKSYRISKSSNFAGVGFVFKVDSDSEGLSSITRYF